VLGVERSISVLEVTCCHLAGPRPFCYEHRLINLEAVPEAAQESFNEMAPGAWLLQRVP
jgi:GntR family histidine utilization transcriptional repressor